MPRLPQRPPVAWSPDLRATGGPEREADDMREAGLYFSRQGQPMTLMEWAEKHADFAYKLVAQHWVRGWMVSTVWLGLDHSFNPLRKGPPVIFETMIFPPGDEAGEDGVWSGEYQERYATEAAAQAGHDRALAAVVEHLGPGSDADITGPLVPGSSDEIPDGPVPDWLNGET